MVNGLILRFRWMPLHRCETFTSMPPRLLLSHGRHDDYPEQFINGLANAQEWDEAKVQKVLDAMSSSAFSIHRGTQDPDKRLDLDLKEKYYETEYRTRPIPAAILSVRRDWSKAQYDSDNLTADSRTGLCRSTLHIRSQAAESQSLDTMGSNGAVAQSQRVRCE